jgi:hypothetical protein
MKNVSSDDMYYLVSDPSYDIVLTDSSGHEVPRKERERGGSRHFVLMKTGEDQKEELDLAGVYVLKTGKYYVRLLRRVAEQGGPDHCMKAISNVGSFTVSDD